MTPWPNAEQPDNKGISPAKSGQGDGSYRYASGLARAMELRLVDSARLNRLLEAHSADELGRILAECGYPAARDPEESMLHEQVAVYGLLQSVLPDPSYIQALLTFHDMHNLKVVLRRLIAWWHSGQGASVSERVGEITDQWQSDGSQTTEPSTSGSNVLPDFGAVDGIPPLGSLASQMFLPATVQPGDLYLAVAERRADRIEPWLYETAVQAVGRYLKSYDLSDIDIQLDQAAWTRAHQLAGRTGNPFFQAWLTRKADLINLELLLRTRTLHAGQAQLRKTLLPGGAFAPDRVLALYGGAADMIRGAYAKTPFADLAALADTYSQPGQAARYSLLADNLLMAHIRQARYIVSGPEVPLAWALARLMEIKNIRIILTGLRNQVAHARIRDMIRDSYLAWR